MDTLEELLKANNRLTDENKAQFEVFRKGLVKLKDGLRI
jgi:hypothetical protein